MRWSQLEAVQVISHKDVKAVQGRGAGFDEHLTRPQRWPLDIHVLHLFFAFLTGDRKRFHRIPPSIVNS
jgi:hypothetical protein